jgi:carboxyl-terminal processing protease
MKRSFTLTLVLAFLNLNALAQGPTARLADPANDPFDIGFAKSFSASRNSTAAAIPTASTRDSKRILSDLAEAIDIIRKEHANGDRIQTAAMTKIAITGALQSLDPHSNYFDQSEYAEFLQEQQSEYSGIGATIAGYWQNGKLDTYITAAIPGSPAAAAKLSFGDRIIKVDDEDVTGKNTDDVRDAVRGTPGTKVRLTIERASTGQILRIEVRRRLVPQPSIRDSFVLPGNIGYIAMTEGFNYTTSEELSSALQQLHKQSVKGLILDIRENPGGILEQAVKIAEKFLPAGSIIVSQRGRSKIDNRVWTSANRNPETLPLVLLVNENSASASEILAGALQDHDRALIVGSRTFGKGLVQSLFDGPGGTGLTLTTARYFTPSGRSIQRDYSGGSMYDYYNHRVDDAAISRSSAHTSGNRPVFGGDGIDPDELSASHQLTKTEQTIDELAFFFSRALVGGRITSFTFDRTAMRLNTSSSAESILKSPLLGEFEKYVRNTSKDVSSDDLRSDESFVGERLAYYVTLAGKGDAAAARVNIENDLPVLKALSQLPRARDLALAKHDNPK